MKPLPKNIIVEPIVQEEVNGIFWRRAFFTAKVMYVGEKCEGISEGDIIRYMELGLRPVGIGTLGRLKYSDIMYKIVDGSIVCLDNKVAINAHVDEFKQLDNGLFVIDKEQPQVIKGEVVSCGTKCECVSKGEVVFVRSTDCGTFEHEDKKYALLRETEVLAKDGEQKN